MKKVGYLELKQKYQSELEKNNIELADFDWICVEITGKKRSLLPFSNFSNDELKKIDLAVKQRLKHIPLGYIFGKTNFYGYDFCVTRDVLIPRIDTEFVVETAIHEIKNRSGQVSVLDIGTGSGAIAITIQKETGAKVTAVDISEKALEVAKQNAKSNGAEVSFIHSDLFDGLQGLKFDFIISNPPYIETKTIDGLSPEVKDYEPVLALDGGESGLEFYEKIILAAKKHLNGRGKIIFEIGYNQAAEVSNLMQKQFKNIKVLKDYGGNDRVVLGEIL